MAGPYYRDHNGNIQCACAQCRPGLTELQRDMYREKDPTIAARLRNFARRVIETPAPLGPATPPNDREEGWR